MVHLITLRLSLADNKLSAHDNDIIRRMEAGDILEHQINPEQLKRIFKSKSTKNSRATKALENIEDKIRSDVVKSQAKSRQMLKRLHKKVQEKTLTESDKKKLEMMNINNTDDNTVQGKLEEMIALTKVINIMAIDIPESELPKVLQTSLKRYRKQQEMEQHKLNAQPNKIITEIKTELREQAQIKTKQLETIEPLHLFALLHYITDKPTREKLQKVLDLNDQMLPNNYLIFENLNQIIEKQHVTGQYFDYEIKKSQVAKNFEKVEDLFLSKLDLSGFKSIPTPVINRVKTLSYEINTILMIQQKFNPTAMKDTSIYGRLVTKILHECYNQIPTIKGKKVLAEYLLHILDIVDVRNQLTRKAFLEMISDAADHHGSKTTISSEIKGMMPKSVVDALTKVQKIKVEEHHHQSSELEDQLGNSLLPDNDEETPRHIDDEDIFNDDIFDDDLLADALL